ncbi:MAG: histidinol-phosphate transaminase [Candidatus Aminicenantes bacterium]
MSMIKPSVSSLDDYAVTQSVTGIKMNQNESPFDLTPELKQNISEKLLRAEWNRYPDGSARSLTRSLSRYTGHPEKGILAGNGSNELIMALMSAVCRPGDRVLVAEPGFSVYKRAAAVMDLNVKEVPLKPDFSYDGDAVFRAGKSCRLMVLASPHNPAGCVFPREGWKRMAQDFPGVLAADEAYFEFSRESVQDLLAHSSRLIILRTLSKAMGLAGLRLGYALGGEELITGMRKARLPFSVGIFQQIAGAAVLENRDVRQTQAEIIIRERDRLFDSLKRIPGVRPFPSRANFILFQTTRESGRSLYEKLYARGILVRCFHQKKLENTLRVTVGSPRDNDIFSAVLRQAVEEKP